MSLDTDPRLQDAIRSISTKISVLRDEIKGFEHQKANQISAKENGQSRDDLETDLITMRAEIDALKRSTPEGPPEDTTINFFLLVAELQNLNETILQQIRLSEKNLHNTNMEIELMKNWISDLKELKVKVEAMAEKSRKNCPPTVSNEEVKRVDNEIRLTRRLYKEFKMFLQTFLMTTRDQGSPQENSSLAMLLQVLWENFNSDKTNYVKISHLDFDVQTSDVTRLLEAGIIELDSEDRERIRMVNFAE